MTGHLDSAVTFTRDRGIRTILSPFHPFEPHVWTALRAVEDDGSYQPLHSLALQWARRGELERVEQLYLALGREHSLSFCDFCDHAVRGLMASVGDEWQNGRLRVGDEHMLSQVLTGALLALRHEWLDTGDEASNGTVRDGPSVAVVGTTEGNRHELGALCIRFLLERRGWQVFYPGPDVPTEDFGMIQKSREATLVCISLPPSGTIGDVSRSLSILSELYDRTRPYSIVFGGASYLELEEGVRQAPFESVGFLQSCHGLRESLQAGLGRPGGSS